jgi:F0F1-type ATP synthase assembly protein I
LDEGKGAGWLAATRFSYLGIFFGVAVLIGCLFGRWLDRKFGTNPWLMMVGALLGIASGFKELYRVATTYGREQKKKQ